jgi:L-ascorbate metabolism protein UlaG (beta-lactamase superfamily)
LEITWLGHSCFRIKGKEATVVFDPCSPDYGYTLQKVQADIVLISHEHPGHNYLDGIAGTFKTVRSPGEYELRGIFIKAVRSFHDVEKGALLGKNVVYVVEIDGIRFCHLGDLGHPPAPELIDEMNDIQVLMIPVGVKSTLPIASAIEIIRAVTPKVVLPMHYKTAKSTRELEPVEHFLKDLGVKDLVPQPKMNLTRANLPVDMQTILLEPQA